VADSKHLEFLQAAITRMAGNSSLVKGWSITLTTAIVGLAVKEGGRDFVLIGLLPVLVFALLDAFYLALEKGFRDRFKIAAATYVAGDSPDFDMSSGFTTAALFKAICRPAVFLVHGLLVIVLVATYLLLCRAA
jgi:hypothetical protein